MRLWRNRQTRTFEGRMGDRMGSSPINRTMASVLTAFEKLLGHSLFSAQIAGLSSVV